MRQRTIPMDWVQEAKKGDKKYTDQIILNMLPTIKRMVKKKNVPPDMKEDLEQEGVLAVLHAINNYKPELNDNFLIYSKYYIRWYIQEYITANYFPITQTRITKKKGIVQRFVDYELMEEVGYTGASHEGTYSAAEYTQLYEYGPEEEIIAEQLLEHMVGLKEDKDIKALKKKQELINEDDTDEA